MCVHGDLNYASENGGAGSEARRIQEWDRKVCRRCVAHPSLCSRIIYPLQLWVRGLAVFIPQAHNSPLSLPLFPSACRAKVITEPLICNGTQMYSRSRPSRMSRRSTILCQASKTRRFQPSSIIQPAMFLSEERCENWTGWSLDLSCLGSWLHPLRYWTTVHRRG